MTLDFTLGKYAEFCEIIRRLECPVMSVRDFLKAGQPEGLQIILRHDVDRQLGAALSMAKLESAYGITSTYYVRMTRTVFKPEVLRQLHALGHEVGYHYESMAKAKGDASQAIAIFERDLQCFREIVPVQTISMHGSPLSSWNNMDLWKTYDFGDYDILGDAVLSINSENLYYATDTGRSWEAMRYNLRDRIPSRQLPCKVDTTDDLIAFLKKESDYPIYVSAHPNRWAANHFLWGISYLSDWTINQIKMIVKLRMN